MKRLIRGLMMQCWYLIFGTKKLIEGQSAGKIISVNEYGQPVLADPELPEKEKPVQEAESRKSGLLQAASDAIAPLQDAVDLDIATAEENALLLASEKISRVD